MYSKPMDTSSDQLCFRVYVNTDYVYMIQDTAYDTKVSNIQRVQYRHTVFA